MNGTESNLEEKILALLKSHHPQKGLHIAPDIPEKKLANARASCEVPETEPILGLIDCTSFGSAKNCLLIGRDRIAFHNQFADKAPKSGGILFSEFKDRTFEEGGFGKIALDAGQVLDVSGCPMPRKNVLRILTELREVVIPETAGPAGEKPEEAPLPLEARILHYLKNYSHQSAFHVSPDIPEKKLGAALASLEVPEGEEILALLDCTLLGSAKESLLFGREGIYFRRAGLDSKPSAMPYSDIGGVVFENSKEQKFFAPGWIPLGNNLFFDSSGCMLSKRKILEILNGLSRLIAPVGSEITTASSPAPRRKRWTLEEPLENLLESTPQVRKEKILARLRACLPATGLNLGSEIPAAAAAAAGRLCELPSDEEIIGLIDLSTTGSDEGFVAFGREALYYHNRRPGKQKGQGCISYAEIKDRVFEDEGFLEIRLGENDFLITGFSPLSKGKIIEILYAVAMLFETPMPENDEAGASGKKTRVRCPDCGSPYIVKQRKPFRKRAVRGIVGGAIGFAVAAAFGAGPQGATFGAGAGSYPAQSKENRCKECGRTWA